MELNKKYTAIVSGATGLIGEQIVSQLLSDMVYDKVIVITRKSLSITHPKLDQRIIDFSALPGAISTLQADHGYCCLGTTIKTAGSKEQQYIIDHDYVVAFAEGCFQAGVSRFAVVSSIGADEASSNFYLRTKGEMERDLRKVHFGFLAILQPSLLLGDRKEHRTGEKAAVVLMKLFGPLMVGSLKKYRGVEARQVARCMIACNLSGETGVKIVRSDFI